MFVAVLNLEKAEAERRIPVYGSSYYIRKYNSTPGNKKPHYKYEIVTNSDDPKIIELGKNLAKSGF